MNKQDPTAESLVCSNRREPRQAIIAKHVVWCPIIAIFSKELPYQDGMAGGGLEQLPDVLPRAPQLSRCVSRRRRAQRVPPKLLRRRERSTHEIKDLCDGEGSG
jgi:hypothetical protein